MQGLAGLQLQFNLANWLAVIQLTDIAFIEHAFDFFTAGQLQLPYRAMHRNSKNRMQTDRDFG
ncbi:hypothetical protein D3C81_1889150 [compost metagenome]